jgi:hypothetical protein
MPSLIMRGYVPPLLPVWFHGVLMTHVFGTAVKPVNFFVLVSLNILYVLYVLGEIENENCKIF